MNFKDIMNDYTDYIISVRRELHRVPELSFAEQKTTALIGEKLAEMGIPFTINPARNTGLVGVISGGKPGPAVALRADIDALPVLEDTGLEFASENKGVMHACGHDNHMAMLLGAAKMLMSVKDVLSGTIYLVFQPGEEVGTGAPYMMEFGDWFEKTGAIFGAHLWCTFPSGTVGSRKGEIMAATEKFTIDISGKQSHGSQPQLGVDAVCIAAATVMNIQAIVARQISPLDSVVVTVGTVNAGDRWNIVGGEAHIEGTVRHFNSEISKKVKASLRSIAENTAAAYGGSATLQYERIVPATINDDDATAFIGKAVAQVLGDGAYFECEKNMGSEDFSYFQEKKPGAYFFIGNYNEAEGTVYSNHSNHFTSDEGVLTGGAAVFAQIAVNWLAAHKRA